MLFDDKTQNNIMIDLVEAVDSDINKEEGSLIDHSFRGAAAEFEQAYINLAMIDQNGYAKTADREHLILRAAERGVSPYLSTNAIWRAVFNTDVPLNSRFSAGESTYICIEKEESQTYKIMCEQRGTSGNKTQEALSPIAYIEGYEQGKLTELLTPARDEEKTEDFRARYFSIISAAQAFGGNRAQYKQAIHDIEGVGACKIYRVTEDERRIKIYFLNSLYAAPDETLVSKVQQIMDPLEKQGEGEGQAPLFHTVDIMPCAQEVINIESEITIDTGYAWEDMLPDVRAAVDKYFLELAQNWENEEYITVRILKINAAIAGVEGVVDVQKTLLSGRAENAILNQNTIPIRGEILCRS